MMLTKPMKKFVMSNDKSGYTRAIQKVYEKRITEYSVDAIKDLTLIAQNLDESTHDKIFNDKTLMPLFKAIFKVHYKGYKDEKEMSDKEKDMIEKRRKRILNLCFDLLFYLGNTSTAWDIAPKAIQMLQNKVPYGIQALLMEPRY